MKKKILSMAVACLLLLAGCTENMQTPTVTEPLQNPPVIEETTPQISGVEALTELEPYLPQSPDTTIYQLQLTPEQAEAYKAGRYHILYEASDGKYLPLYMSVGVTCENGLLTANFNGKVVYARDAYYNRCLIPTTEEYETVNDKTHYGVYLSLGKYVPAQDGSEEQEYITQLFQLHMICNRQSGQIENCALLPSDEPAPADLFTAQPEPIDLGGWDTYAFPTKTYRVLTRDDAGNVLPLEQWEETGGTGIQYWNAEQGLQFFYGRLATVRYPAFATTPLYILFEMQDQQGHIFGSEPQQLNVLQVQRPEATAPSITVDWSTGNRILLLEEAGVSLYLRKTSDGGTLYYTLELHNETKTGVSLWVEDILYNEKFYNKMQTLYAEAGKWGSLITPLEVGLEADVGELIEFSSLSFTIDSYSGVDIPKRRILVNLSGDAAVTPVSTQEGEGRITASFMGARAQEQILLDKNGVQVTLVGQGQCENEEWLWNVLRLENTADTEKTVVFEGLAVNGAYLNEGCQTYRVLPQTVQYRTITVQKAALEELGIQSIANTQFRIGVQENADAPVVTQWVLVKLSETGSGEGLLPEGTLLLEERGIRISLLSAQDVYGRMEWKLAVVNTTDKDICLELLDVAVGQEQGIGSAYMSVSLEKPMIAAGLYGAVTVKGADSVSPVSFRLAVKDFTKTQTWFETENSVYLLPKMA